MNDLGDNLLRFKKKQKYLTFDYETSGLCGIKGINTPWQLGWQTHIGNELIQNREDWIKWDHKFEMGKDAMRITHFTWEKYYEKAKDAVTTRKTC